MLFHKKNHSQEEAEKYSSVNLEEPVSDPLKNHSLLFLVLLVVLIAAIAAGISYYLSERHKPVQTLENYLGYVRDLDETNMAALLQSNDLTALEQSDLHNPAYSNFYKKMAKKMQFQIIGTRFSLQSDTAAITAHIRYVDAAPLYDKTIREFLSQMVDSAFSPGSSLKQSSKNDTKLAKMLEEGASDLGYSYTETDLVFPLIRQSGEWKIVALDDETVRIMCSNVLNIQQEIDDTISDSTKDPSTEKGEVSTDSQILELNTDTYQIQYKKHEFTVDFGGNPCLLFYYDYTNTGTEPSSALLDVNLLVYQHGHLCPAAIPEEIRTTDHYFREVLPGETLLICQAFSLKDLAPVTIHAEAQEEMGNLTVHSLVLHPEDDAKS